VLGLVVGSVFALTGAGGGILATPLLVFGLGLNIAEAGPVALLAVSMAAALGAALGLRAHIVRYKAALLMAVTGTILSIAGIWLAERIDGRWLGLVLAAILLWVALRTIRQGRSEAAHGDSRDRATLTCIRNKRTGRFVWTSRCAGVLTVFGSVAGLLSGLVGVGGGFVLVPALRRYSDLEMESVVATSLTVTALLTLTGALSSVVVGHMEWNVALPFLAGTLTGMTAGRSVASRLPAPHLQYGFALFTAVAAVAMLFKSIR
jgi:uncharacterized membrane protein YfcA